MSKYIPYRSLAKEQQMQMLRKRTKLIKQKLIEEMKNELEQIAKGEKENVQEK